MPQYLFIMIFIIFKNNEGRYFFVVRNMMKSTIVLYILKQIILDVCVCVCVCKSGLFLPSLHITKAI